MGEYSKALSYYEKSLEIKQQSLPPNHPDLAGSYMNIGNVYDNMGEYSKALSYYEKSLEIKQQSLPPNHPDLAASYMNIGIVYNNMGEYSKALSSHEKSLEILQQSLPPNHPDLAASYMNIGNVYETWVNIPKHFRITKNHLKFNNNHFLQIILIWLCIKTWVYPKAYEKSLEIILVCYTKRWVIIRKRIRIMNAL